MSIKSIFGPTLTPKLKAQEMIVSKLDELVEGYWIEQYEDEMTEREIKLVSEQIKKQVDRIITRLNLYDPWSAQ